MELWSLSHNTGPWKDCYHVRQAGYANSGMYLIKPEGTEKLIQVWCDHSHDQGGWTVIQRRVDGAVNFFRNWDNYKVNLLKTLLLLFCGNLCLSRQATTHFSVVSGIFMSNWFMVTTQHPVSRLKACNLQL